MFALRGPLFEESKDPPAGGAPPPAAFTPEQLTALGQVVNSALTDKLKGFEKNKLGPAIAESLKGLNWEETLSPVMAKFKPPEPEPKPADGKPDPKVTALESQLADVKKLLAAEAAERQKAVDEGRAKDARAALRSALTPHVRADALDIAVRDLFDAQKRVTLDENGRALIKVSRADYSGAPEDVDMPLTDGVAQWIKTSEGKFFAPAPGGTQETRGGAGPRRSTATGRDGLPQYDGPATTDEEKVRRAEERESAYRARHPHLT